MAVEALEVFRCVEGLFGQRIGRLAAMCSEGSGIYRVSLMRLGAVRGGILVDEVVIWGFGLVVAEVVGVNGGGVLGIGKICVWCGHCKE